MFAHFDIVDYSGQRVAEGHKASFCLEDRECADGVDPRYDCQNYGDQVQSCCYYYPVIIILRIHYSAYQAYLHFAVRRS